MTEQPKPIDLTAMTVEALKALAYDQLRILQQTQANINAIEAEINKRTEQHGERNSQSDPQSTPNPEG